MNVLANMRDMARAIDRLRWAHLPVVGLWRHSPSVASAVAAAVLLFLWPAVPVRGVDNWLFIFVNTPYLTVLYPPIAMLSGVLVGLFVYQRAAAPSCHVAGREVGVTGSAVGVFLSVCPTCVPAIAVLFPLGFNVAMSRLAPVFSIIAVPILLFSIWRMNGFHPTPEHRT